MNAVVLCVAVLRRCPKDGGVQGSACLCLGRLCGFDRGVVVDALSMGAMELALAALRTHRSEAAVCANASELLDVLCHDEAAAVKAKQLGAPVLLQAVLKAHPAAKAVHANASGALARIQKFVDAASARADAKMAELIAGEDATKGGKGAAAASKKMGKGKGRGKGGEGVTAVPPLPPLPPQTPIATDGEPALTKAKIKRRKAKAAAAARKAAATSGSAAAEEDAEGSEASSSDSEPPCSRPPLDFSKDAEFRRRLPPIMNSPLVISPELLAASDAILAAHAALYATSPSAQPAAAATTAADHGASAAGAVGLAAPERTVAGGTAAESVAPEPDAAAVSHAASAPREPPSPGLTHGDAAIAAHLPGTLPAALAMIASQQSEIAALRTQLAALTAGRA